MITVALVKRIREVRTLIESERTNTIMPIDNLDYALDLLNKHHAHFFEAQEFAAMTSQPTPEDSRAWSQILISLLTGTSGLARHKGQDLEDGSDVKSANAWFSIDKVRFNGVIKAGTRSSLSGKMEYLDQMPFLFFVLWDHNPDNNRERVRVWVVRPQYDRLFREMACNWYEQLANGRIRSNNFQLHPPVNENDDVFTNQCGNLMYPLLFNAEWNGYEYNALLYDSTVLHNGRCQCID
jgi:hypothetical protein